MILKTINRFKNACLDHLSQSVSLLLFFLTTLILRSKSPIRCLKGELPSRRVAFVHNVFILHKLLLKENLSFFVKDETESEVMEMQKNVKQTLKLVVSKASR